MSLSEAQLCSSLCSGVASGYGDGPRALEDHNTKTQNRVALSVRVCPSITRTVKMLTIRGSRCQPISEGGTCPSACALVQL